MLLEHSLMVRAWVWSQPKLASNPSSANVLSVFKAACPVDAGDKLMDKNPCLIELSSITLQIFACLLYASH